MTRIQLQRLEMAVMARSKALARVTAINRMAGNSGIAGMLAVYQANHGDWRKLFSEIDDLSKVTAEDLQRVMIKYFVPASSEGTCRRKIARSATVLNRFGALTEADLDAAFARAAGGRPTLVALESHDPVQLTNVHREKTTR